MRKRLRDHPLGDGLVIESAAFLNGTLAEQWEAQGLKVPPWGWINLLAHGSEERIAESIHRPYRHHLLARKWWIARSELAEVVLEVTKRSSSLSELQNTVLIPLELHMSSHPEACRWNYRQWVDTVTSALRQHDTPSSL
jgi:hypothetical protein